MTQLEEDRELIQGFVADGCELLDELEPDLIELHTSCQEGGSVDAGRLNAVFRLFHSLKGAAGCLNLHTVTQVTHEAENMLNFIRDGSIMLTPVRTDVLCRACDLLRSLLHTIETQGCDSGFEEQACQVVSRLKAALQLEDAPPAAQPDAENVPAVSITPEMRQSFIQESDELLDAVEQALLEIGRSSQKQDCLDMAFRSIHSFKGNCGFMGFADLERLSHSIENVLDSMKEGITEPSEQNVSVIMRTMDSIRNSVTDAANGGAGSIKGCSLMVELIESLNKDSPGGLKKLKLGEILVARGIASASEVDAALEMQGKSYDEILTGLGPAQAEAAERKISRRDIRVDIDKLDLLMELVGEMVIAQMMVVNNSDLRGRGYELDNFDKACHHLERISTDLQDVALAIRMVPLAANFRKMIRLVHDLSLKFSKMVRLELKGEETEVDKTVIEHISDPLVHIIRNAIDHGIEKPDRRRQLGKDETGAIVLEARHDGGDVVILISDDGGGLDRARILAKGIEKGLVRGNPETMKDSDIYGLIFEPGFSTADQVTDVSGRGVGMDVVRKNLEKIKGRVEIKSAPGKGTTFILHIPLTLAIIEGMIVRVGGSRYIIPLLAIMESFRPDPKSITVLPDGTEMVKVRGSLLQVARLHLLQKVRPDTEQLHEGLLVVVENQGEQLCLFLDEVVGQIQTVIKGLPGDMSDVEGLAGCSIMGDGEVCLILDIGGLIVKAKASTDTSDAACLDGAQQQ